MRWRGERRSQNVKDMRGRGRALVGGGGIGAIILAIIIFALGGNPMDLLRMLDSSQTTVSGSAPGAAPPADDEQAQFVATILASTEDVWNRLFAQSGANYREPSLVMFERAISSACGFTSSAVGPFYCPGDQQVYIDLSFFRQLDRMGAPGDFARAYVIGHEVGHHVQQMMGTSRQVRMAQQQARSQAEQNALQVAMELQADCYAGVWAHHAERERNLLEEGDVEEGLRAAQAIGDDTLQRRSGRQVAPDSFTHGSAEQRARWLLTGLQSGDPAACDTFGG